MFEKYGTKLCVAFLALIYMLYGPDFFVVAKQSDWEIGAIYSSIFDMSSVVCAFLFSFYIFVKTTDNRYLNAARGSKTYDLLLKYFLFSIISSFIPSIVTIPFQVVVPVPTEHATLLYVVLLPWVMLCGYVFAAVVRSALHFIEVIDWAYGKVA